jgi:hypothetical protein
MTAARLAVPILLVSMLAACDSEQGPESGGSVALRFGNNGSTANAQELTITGSNGTLSISDIAFIVNEFELERGNDACDRVDNSGPGNNDHLRPDDCEEFEVGPFFVKLPLTGSVSVVRQEVPPGAYSELEFEVEDLDVDDEADEDMMAALPNLRSQIQSAGFANWPDSATMVVVGTFTPTGGTARPFTVFFDAEIEIELRFNPPLLVEQAERTVTVEINPTAWFRASGNRVVDLSQFNFATTSRLLRFEVELRDGFQEIEFDR